MTTADGDVCRGVVVDGEAITVHGAAGEWDAATYDAFAEIVRAARRKFAETPQTPEQQARQHHRQGGRADGTWGCACGWVQDKPHRDHVADMVAAATTPETGA